MYFRDGAQWKKDGQTDKSVICTQVYSSLLYKAARRTGWNLQLCVKGLVEPNDMRAYKPAHAYADLRRFEDRLVTGDRPTGAKAVGSRMPVIDIN